MTLAVLSSRQLACVACAVFAATGKMGLLAGRGTHLPALLVVFSLTTIIAVATGSAAAVARPSSPSPSLASDVDAQRGTVGLYHLTSFDCDTVSPVVPDGRRGWFAQLPTAGSGRHFVPSGTGACASPVEYPDVFNVVGGTRGTDTASPAAEGATAPHPLGGPDGTRLVATALVRRSTLAARFKALARRPEGSRFVEDVQYWPLPPDNGLRQGAGGLVQEASLFRLLTLTHHTIAGSVHRETGEYDVLGVSRVTLGMCQAKDCADASAVAVAESQAVDFANAKLPLLVLDGDLVAGAPRSPGQPPEPSAAATLSMVDDDVLSLGRAVLAHPARLGTSRAANATWRLRARVTLEADASADSLSGNGSVQSYFLGELGTPVSRAWLPSITRVLCHSPTVSFVRGRRDTLCGGRPSPPPPRPRRPGVFGVPMMPVFESVPPRSSTRRSSWFISPRLPADDESSELPSCPPLANVDEPPAAGLTPRRPAWVAALGGREINPSSPAEAALAASTSSCWVNATDSLPHDPSMPVLMLQSIINPDRTIRFGAVEADLLRLSNGFDSGVFAEDPPADPVTTGPLLLALLVLVPEIIALMGVYLATARVGRRELLLLGLFFLAGLVSLTGIVSLAVIEVNGAGWRAAAMRDELRLDLGSSSRRTLAHGGVMSLAAAAVYRTETVIVVARTGYRPRLLVGMAVGSSVLYAVLSVAVAGLALRQLRHWKRKHQSEAPNDGEQESCPVYRT